MSQVEVQQVSEEECSAFYLKHQDRIFRGIPTFSLQRFLNDKERERLSALRSMQRHQIRIYLLAKIDNKPVGWSWGMQSSYQSFYMCSSAVLPRYRRQGIYSQLLKTMIQAAKHHGFVNIESRHLACNNPVIIAKLRQGFVITGTELDIHYGFMVRLSYFTKKASRQMLFYRAGMKAYDEDIQDCLRN